MPPGGPLLSGDIAWHTYIRWVVPGITPEDIKRSLNLEILSREKDADSSSYYSASTIPVFSQKRYFYKSSGQINFMRKPVQWW